MSIAMSPGRSEFLLGNLGITHAWHQQSGEFFELGVALPTTGNGKPLARSYAGFGDMLRFHRFGVDLWRFSCRVGRTIAPGQAGISTSAGVDVLRPEEGDSEILARYGLGVVSHGELVASAVVSGMWLMSAESGNLAQATLHQLNLGIESGEGRVRPGLFLGLPMDEDLSLFVDGMLVLRLTVR